jgi:class 3 adenylate cyclase/dihydrofolate reductase
MRQDARMGKLVVTDFVTVDGIIEAPGMDEHRTGRNAWALRVTTDELETHNLRQILEADAVLLGRVTYQIWAAFWPGLPVREEMATRLDEIPKYVVSRSLRSAEWQGTHVLRGDVGEEVRRLKAEFAGDILCYGSAELVGELMRLDLVDEYRLIVFPVILGSGKHLFHDEIATRHLRLVRSQTFSSGPVLLVYQPEREVPTSRFVEEYTWTQEQVQSLHAAQDITRVLATILFTDIVDSTGRAAALGDRAWRGLLDRHDEVAASEVDRWRGNLVKSTGDGILATFDAPTRALQCAFRLREAMGGLDLQIRAAIHTGEVELREADVGGIGVHIAARALAEAHPGQVVVTRTVRDLATGTDLGFAPLGTVGLRGVPGQWELFEATTGQSAPR